MSLARQITQAKGGDWSGQQGLIPTPGHSPADRGLSVRDHPTDATDIILYAHNEPGGGDWRSFKDQLREEGLLPDRENSRRQVTRTPFEYIDADGAAVYRTVRIEPGRNGKPKDFIAERQDGNGGWVSGLKGAGLIPYRLPQMIAAHPESAIFIVEGEKKADALAALDFTATCNPFGAGSWPSGWGEKYLKGRDVVILPDNDKPGREHASAILRDILPHAASVRVVDLPGLPDKGDIIDWLGQGRTGLELVQLVDQTPFIGGGEAQKPDFSLPVEFYGEVRPSLQRRYHIKGFLPSNSTAVVFGFPGSGKSFLTLDALLHVAAGMEWHERKVQKGGVAYVAAEGQAGFRLRIEAWRRAHDVTSNIPFALIPASVDLLDPDADLSRLGSVLQELAALWGGVAVLAIDTLSATFGGGDENGSDMAAYVSNIARLCAPYGCSSVIVHHQPLNAEAKRPRGHGSLWGAADTVLHVTGDHEAAARRVHVLKQKDADPGPDILFTLNQVELGIDDDGDVVTSCIVEAADLTNIVSVKGRRLAAKEKISVRELERVIAEKGIFPPSAIPDKVLNRARTGKVVAVSEWRSAALSALQSPDTKPDTARRSFERVRDALQAAEIVGIWEDFAWLV